MIEINLAQKHKQDRTSLWALFLFKASLILGFSAFLALHHSEADQGHEACLDRMNAALKDKIVQQDLQYRNMDPNAPSGIRPGNEPKILRGRNRQALILLHGYLASPFEVTALAEDINRAGWTVYLPLIYGFGGSVTVANNATVEDWKKTVTDALDLVSNCYGHVSLGGFSLGGGLVTDFVLNNPLVTTPGMFNETQIDSLLLLSPYTRPKGVVMKPLINALSNWFGFNDISFSALNFISMGDRDLKAILKYPQYYVEAMPMKAAQRTMDFAEMLDNTRETIQSEVPVYYAFSELDGSVDPKYGEAFLKKHFATVKAKIFTKEDNLPHQIQLKDDFANPNAEDLYERTVKFFMGHTHGTDPKQD